jgi:oligoribonuclease NrnB/cAMP/cGMP phosphodiesterase (DHH superfamily)
MKNKQKTILAGLLIALSINLHASNPEESTLQQKVIHAAHRVAARSGALWKRFKNWFSFSCKGSPYKSSIVPLQVRPQDGAECGLCAVENGTNVLRYLINETQDQTMGDFERAAYARYSGAWRKHVLKKFGHKDDLHDDELEYVARELAQLPREAYTILPSVKQFDIDFLTQEQRNHFIETINSLRKDVGALHLFILGNMGQAEDKEGKLFGIDGHWVSAVVERVEDGFIYYTTDSMSSKCPSIVESLQKLVEEYQLPE